MVQKSGETGSTRDSEANNMSDEELAAAQEVGQATKDSLDDDVDAILDEIDDVLEVNAEDFVRAFIQKGGQ